MTRAARLKSKPFISLEGVTIQAHGREIFTNLSWEIKSNEQWAVIGPNGSGRSSLMRAIAGTLPVTRGKITHASDDIEYVSFETQRALLPHETFLQDRWNVGLSKKALTVSEYLSERGIRHANPFIVENKAPIPILHFKVKYRDSEFAIRQQNIIREFELKPLLNRTFIELSNGERRKVLIARALLKNPELLILDNPFEGLDEQFRIKLSRILDDVMKRGMTLILVAADWSVILPAITHVFSINENGSIIKGAREGMLTGKAVQEEEKLPSKVRGVSGAKRGEIIVRMKKVNVSYNGRNMLQNINWTIREYERWALFGPNGAGKTTLLSLILGDNPQAYANDITIFGKKRGSGESIWEIKKNIGWVAPELQLYYPPHMTCLDVACSGWFDSIGLYRQCTEDQREIALAALQEFGVAAHAGESFSDVSEGEQRLTLLARAMIKNPRLLILDEPCQGLDPKHRDRVLEAIDSIEKETTTMIYVTHRADELPKTITNLFKLKQPDH